MTEVDFQKYSLSDRLQNITSNDSINHMKHAVTQITVYFQSLGLNMRTITYSSQNTQGLYYNRVQIHCVKSMNKHRYTSLVFDIRATGNHDP